MKTKTGRVEEFGAAPWAGLVLAVLLVLSLAGAALHPSAAPTQTAPAAASISAQR